MASREEEGMEAKGQEGATTHPITYIELWLTYLQLVEAGWCFDPSQEAEDGTTCFYCNLSLDGWEPKDNPMYAQCASYNHTI